MQALKAFGPDLWIADGPIVRALAIPFPTRMIVVKLGDGSLWINSPVSVSESELEDLISIGAVNYLVAPTPFHVWRLHSWAQLFPEAQRWGPPGMRRRRFVSFDHVLADEPPQAWSRDFDQLIFKGNMAIREVFFFHRKSRTLIVADLIQNYPPYHGRPLLNMLLKLGGVLNGGVAIDIRLSFFNRALGRKSLERLLSWNFDKLIVAHGACIESGAKRFVEEAFRWLK